MKQNNQIEENILQYKDLKPFSDESNILAVMRDIIKTINDQDDLFLIYTSITNLRKFNKYNSYLFSEIFNTVFTRFIYIFSSTSDPKLALNSIYLVKEILSFYEDYIQDWVKDLTQIVLFKALCDDDQLVKEQAILALHNVTDKMHFQETIEILLEYINLDDGFSELSFQLLYALIMKFDQGVFENLDGWENTFLDLIEMYSSKIKKQVKFSTELFMVIYDKIGKNRFNEFLTNCGLQDETSVFVDMIIGEIYPNGHVGESLLNSNLKLKSANKSSN